MKKQEEIREGIKKKLLFDMKLVSPMVSSELEYNANELAKEILAYLHSQGVVIRGNTLGLSHPHLANYFTVEPLIKEA